MGVGGTAHTRAHTHTASSGSEPVYRLSTIVIAAATAACVEIALDIALSSIYR